MPDLHRGQRKVRDEARRFNVLCCGRRWGKTVFGLTRAIQPAALWGKPVGWFAPTYKLLAEAWRELILLARPRIVAKHEQEKRLTLEGGGVIECWTLQDEHAGRGRKYRRVIVDEAAMTPNLEAAWLKAIRPTLTDYRGDAWFLSTPLGRRNYFHTLYQHGQASDEPNWASWRMPTLANPYIHPEEIEDARRDMSRIIFSQEYEAEFVETDGAAWFPTFSEATHRTPDAEFDPALPAYLAIDPGVWTGAVLFQVRRTPDRAYWVNVFADYLAEDVKVEENARQVKALIAERCGKVAASYCDPAGGAKNPIGDTLITLYGKAGLYLEPWDTANPSVADSLELVRSLLDPADGVIRLHIHPRCRHLIGAFQDYRRARRKEQWMDWPEDPQHPAEDLIDALRGGLHARIRRAVDRLFS